MCSNWLTTRSMMLAAALLPAIGAVLCAQETAVDVTAQAAEGVIDNRPIGVPAIDALPAGEPEAAAAAGSACEPIGGWTVIPPLFGSNRFRGNAYSVDADVKLVQYSVELAFAVGATSDLEFAGYRLNPISGIWERLTAATKVKAVQGTGTRTYYSTGVLDPPVALAADEKYVFGVAWTVQSIQYNRDQLSYPRNFSVGSVLGRVSLNNPPSPMPDEQLAFSISGNGVYSMELCLTGACCLPAGTCIDVTEAGCLGNGGQFSAPGVSCADIGVCPMVRGACCLDPATCTFINEYACGSIAGDWNESVLCDDPIEPCAPRGACCFADDTHPDYPCAEGITISSCALRGGWYRGDNVTCDAFPPCTAGACCTPDACALELTEADCLLSGGEYKGPGTRCADNPCDPTGACCLGTTCSVKTRTACLAQAGVYKGDDVACADLPVPCGKGACCRGISGCYDAAGAGTTRTFCTNTLGGTYTDGQSCATIDPRCPGTCCGGLGIGCLDDVRPTDCLTKALGVFIGYELACPTQPEPTTATETDPCAAVTGSAGACCLGNGNCAEVDNATTCTSELSGLFLAGESCAAGACTVVPEGACCNRAVLACTSGVTQAACPYEWTEGKTCGQISPICEPLGACCDEIARSCVNSRTSTQCADSGGTWHVGMLCRDLDPPCAPTGACCVAEPQGGTSCTEQTSANCTLAGGTYRGNGTTCSTPFICNLGACCQRNGLCEDGVLQEECTAPAGDPPAVFHTGQLCDNVCFPRGACCVAGDCQITTGTQCTNLFGVYEGDGSDCTANLCEIGTCCEANFLCTNTKTRQLCENSGGVYLTAGGSCDEPVVDCQRGSCCAADATCKPNTVVDACDDPEDFMPDGICGQCTGRGACCVSGGSCEIVDRQSCLAAGGQYGGNASVCEPADLCSVGACCFGDGSCSELSRRICEPAGGTYIGAGVVCGVDTCSAGCEPAIVASNPPSCAIDARYPHDPLDTGNRMGWTSVELELDCEPTTLVPADFSVTVVPNGIPAPTITNVALTATTATVTLDGPIPAQRWTCIELTATATKVCLGSLPGDADNGRAANAVDVLAIIDNLNGTFVPAMAVYQCDIDRSGVCNAADVLGVIDLLNGAGLFDAWNNLTLPVCPVP